MVLVGLFLSPVPRRRWPYVLLLSASLLPLAREMPLLLGVWGCYTTYFLSLGTFEVVYELTGQRLFIQVEMNDGHTTERMVRGMDNTHCICVMSYSLPIWNSSDSDSRTSFQFCVEKKINLKIHTSGQGM